MHTDNTLASHGKQVSSDSRAQMPGATQQPQLQGSAANAHLGSKGGAKATQMSHNSSGLKASGQSVGGGGVAGMLKLKSKRSASIDCGESRSAAASVLEADAKGEGVQRSKRRCVLAKKQPYSGDEWCSGPETDDEEKPHAAAHREQGLAASIQGLSERLSAGNGSEPTGLLVGCGAGSGLKAEPPQPTQQMLYVFSTSLANSAAEAVMKGQAESILHFHQQSSPLSKPEQGQTPGKPSSLLEKMNTSTSPRTGTPKSQSGTPRPASAGVVAPSAGTPMSAGHSDTEGRPGTAPHSSIASHRSEGGNAVTPAGPEPGNRDGSGSIPSGSPSILSAHLHGDAVQMTGSGLSKEQLEHRERSLQTLRDIERLFLRSGTAGGPGDAGGPNHNTPSNSCNLNNNGGCDRSSVEDSGNGTNNNCTSMSSALVLAEGLKKYEEPLQSIISQTQSLGGPALDSPQMDPQHQMSSPGDDMSPLPGPEGLTREQMAWRKLQEEYYQEKRRQQEIHSGPHPQHFRMSEVGVHGELGMMRGPPPPYHSKPGDQQWGPASMMAGGMGGNGRMLDIHQEGPRGPRFPGQMQRGGGSFPGSPGAVLPMEGLGPQRSARQGMIWLDDMPNNIGGGNFHGGYPGGPPQHLQSDPELLTREEMFRIMEKRHMQGLPRYELERLAKHQQQGNLGPRMLENLAGPDFPNLGMGRGPLTNRGDPMDFPGPREMIDSSGSGPQMRDLVNSPLGCNISMSMNPQMNIQQQQMMLSQRLRGSHPGGGFLSEMFGAGEISRINVSQNGRVADKGMVPGSFQFPNQAPFPGEQLDRRYLQQPGPDMFRPDNLDPNQMGGTSRLSHMPLTGGLRGADLSSRHTSDVQADLNPLTSPSVPPHPLKSPSFNQEPSPLLPSPSAPALKSPITSAGHRHAPPSASGAGTPCSSSMKSPQILGSSSLGLHSPSASPGRLKSPAMALASPGWASPKTTLPSPGGPTGGKALGNGGSTSTEAGQPLPPRSSNSTPVSQPGSMNPNIPFTSSPDATAAQNPLSLIMSQMSKYAVPSSTPLYHDAIKTIATSDDEMLPDRPLLSGVSIGGNMGNARMSQGLGPHSNPQSPMSLINQGQLSHDGSGAVLSPQNQMAMPAMNTVIMRSGGHAEMGPNNSSSLSQTQMAGFPRMQPPPPHSSMHSPIRGMLQGFSQSNEDTQAHQQLQLLSKGPPPQRPFHRSDSFASLPMSDGPDLSEVIRPTHTGIPEFDLSRIIPADKPSSTLQYFPKNEPHQGAPPQQHVPQQLLKQMPSSGLHHGSSPSSNPHLASLQNMAEQQLPPHPSPGGVRQNMGISPGVSRGMGPMCPPGHMMGRTGMMPQPQMQQHQAMMPNSLLPHPPSQYAGMMAPSPHNMMTQQNLMMMQAKQRAMPMPGEPFGHQGPVMAPPHPQAGMMLPQSLRQRGMSLDSPVGYGSGGMANMPF
uniref:Bcl9 like n=1 Tax=Oryzias latipes TaxID=8090 RepID=A0A3P9IXH2_ORYLA